MVQLIVGVKGEGKTKKMLEHVHNILASTDGNVVYLDKSTQNMHELDNRVRLINVTEYPIQNTDQFIGFVCGICSQDYDLQEIYLDGFLKIAKLEGQDISSTLSQLNQISEQFHVTWCSACLWLRIRFLNLPRDRLFKIEKTSDGCPQLLVIRLFM